MPVTLLQNVEFGPFRADITGSTGVGYTVYDVAGNVVSARTTAGVYELVTGSGVYAANVTYPDNFNGQIVWDCPAVTASFGILAQSFAVEEYNVEANDPKVGSTWQMVNSVTGSIEAIYDLTYGRWQIIDNQMLFYAQDNTTLLATYNLFDDAGNPTMDAVFQRVLVGSVNPNPP
jgi:hypothetical protein